MNTRKRSSTMTESVFAQVVEAVVGRDRQRHDGDAADERRQALLARTADADQQRVAARLAQDARDARLV